MFLVVVFVHEHGPNGVLPPTRPETTPPRRERPSHSVVAAYLLWTVSSLQSTALLTEEAGLQETEGPASESGAAAPPDSAGPPPERRRTPPERRLHRDFTDFREKTGGF